MRSFLTVFEKGVLDPPIPPKVFTAENTLFRFKQNNSLRCPCELEEVYSYQEILSLDSGGRANVS